MDRVTPDIITDVIVIFTEQLTAEFRKSAIITSAISDITGGLPPVGNLQLHKSAIIISEIRD